MTASAPLPRRPRDGDRHAAVLEAAGRVHALELEVGLDPEPLRQPRRGDQRRRALHQRDDRRRPRRAAAGRGSARSGASGSPAAPSAGTASVSRDELLLDHPDRPRRRAQQVELRDLRRRRSMKRPSATGCTTITSRAFSPMPFCTTLFTLTPLSPRIFAISRQHARLVRDLEVQVEGRLDLLAGDQPQLLDRLEVHAARAHHRHDVAEHRRRRLRPARARARTASPR